MKQKEISASNMNDLLPYIAKVIEWKEINISDMAIKQGINRKTIYNKLYSNSKDLKFISQLCSYLGIKITITLAVNE